MIDIDLRSDTVTRPTPAMRDAMAAAEVGDDVYGEDPTVNALERRTAHVLGKEAALFVPSGTMANQLGILAQTRTGDELWTHAACHMVDGEQAGAAVLGRVQTRMFDSVDGLLDPEQMRPWLRDPGDPHNPRQRLVTIENTMGYRGGAPYPLDAAEAVRAFADEHGFRLHVDGARLWNAAVAQDVPPARLAAVGDTVSVCFSKSLGAPVGSALAGSTETIGAARRARKLLGGGMRQAGVIAAGALHALEHHRDRLADDHRRARTLAGLLDDLPGVVAATPTTSFVLLHVARGEAPAAVERIVAAGVGCLPLDDATIRLVVHLEITDDDVVEAGTRIRRALGADGPQGRAR